MRRVSKKARERGKLIKELDRLTKVIIHARDGNKCVKCGKGPPEIVLQAAHILSKGPHGRLRFELLNLLSMCLRDHLYWWHKNPVEAYEWLQEKYPGRIEQLRIMTATARKLDLMELLIGLRLEVSKLERTTR